MHLILKRFSQDVDLDNPEKINYFLVLEQEGGTEIRLPVQKETTETLINSLYGKVHPSQNVDKEEPVPQIDKYLEEDFNNNLVSESSAVDAEEEQDFEEDLATHPSHIEIPESEDAIESL